ncbi:MAG: hypothetical protein SO287_08880 [Parabacteroides sp.]|nr:hypothetical protein [Bacteroides sp.]MDY4757683.1 hypothetical protein [Parabacteroides sp.]
MSGFWIFAIILTVAYVLYYGIIISIDLYGKPKEQSKGSEETFEFKDMEFEQPKAVEETSGGFRISENDGDGGNKWNETLTRTVTPPSEQQDAPKLDATGASLSPAQEKIKRTEENMEDIDVQMNGELMDEAMKAAMLTGKPLPVKINKVAAGNSGEGGLENGTKGIDRL